MKIAGLTSRTKEDDIKWVVQVQRESDRRNPNQNQNP
jgi:hypothetical protein